MFGSEGCGGENVACCWHEVPEFEEHRRKYRAICCNCGAATSKPIWPVRHGSSLTAHREKYGAPTYCACMAVEFDARTVAVLLARLYDLGVIRYT